MTFTSCKKEKQEEPPQQTENGSNILWCKINGTPVTVRGKSNFVNEKGVVCLAPIQLFDKYIAYIDASGIVENYSLSLVVDCTGENNNLPMANTKYNALNKLDEYESEYSTDNVLYILDTNKTWIQFSRFDNIAAGTFEFYGKGANGQTVSITEGWFDIAL